VNRTGMRAPGGKSKLDARGGIEVETVIGEIGENRVVQKKLRDVAAKLTSDCELRKDLTQEMLLHLFQIQREHPGKASTWYVKSCEFHARNYLRLGRSIDSYKRARGAVRIGDAHGGEDEEFFHEQFFHRVDGIDSHSSQREVVRDDLLALITPHLSATQAKIMHRLMQGHGVREIARELGITHPAVIKHRKKIARIAREFLQDTLSASSADTPG